MKFLWKAIIAVLVLIVWTFPCPIYVILLFSAITGDYAENILSSYSSVDSPTSRDISLRVDAFIKLHGLPKSLDLLRSGREIPTLDKL
jgi:hypothetical protein